MERLKINIHPNSVKSMNHPTFHASENDRGRVIRAELVDNGSPYTLTGSERISIKIQKPSGEVISVNLANTAHNYIDITLNENMTDFSGMAYCKIQIKTNSKNICTSAFNLQIEPKP